MLETSPQTSHFERQPGRSLHRIWQKKSILTFNKIISPALVVLLQALLHVLRKVGPLIGCVEGAGEQHDRHLR